ncbi:PREDICTED: receptor-type tyrosine-protein phosphatase F-like [Amphimedon queenslandica]|uniref:Protein-tyrosine-phosphatase n=1 Tax=Amphimedon queenslandica TaxID=400682 RepID=A0AAN0JNY9_AMPQE|nr:PREDICTED: receptor-type tyrosine-protein phosphatase F-like [Amphimedon queenslandica]|eukprot:XP_019858755.1 PREDICTED: receptor-type tyrosine-protein phosphatase F-like [Amphimedon queenslandica]
MNQRVMDREQCTYKNDLIVENSVNRLGTYRCEVKSLRHNNVTIDTTVGSVTVQAAGNVRVAVTTMGSQEVGESFYLNCTVNKINNVSLEIRWMKDNVTIVSDMSKGVMLGGIGEDADSVSRVLNLSPIRLSHTGQYSCDAVNGSAVDGRATIRVDIDAPYLSLSLDPSPDLSLTLGEEYTLMCAALLPDSLNPTVASITWYKDTVPFTSNGITTNLAEGTSNLNLGTVLSQEAGNYTCVANVSSPYIDTGYNLIVSNTTLITVSMPEPNSVVLALNYLSPPYYAGLRRDLQCSIDSLYIHNDPTVTVSVDILFNDTIVPSGLSSNGRKNLQQLSSNPSGGQYRKTLQFQYFVSSEDSGVYTCMVSVSSNYLSSYIVNASISRTNEYDIVAPKPAVLLNSTRYHLPNHPSYNTATLMCTATLQLITFDFLVFPKVLTWSGPSVSSATPATNPTGAVSESSLQQTYTTAGSYNYSCTVSVSVPGDPTASTTDAISVIVTAPSPPHSPVNTSAVNIRYNSATIRWIVPSIAYTPEEYVVLYGTNSTNMNDLSSVVNGSTNFSIIDSVLTVDLFDLTHDTVYHFRIRSTNTEGSTESDTNSFKTREKPPTAPPSNFTINTNTNSRSLSFSWDPPPPEHRNGDILAYNLTCYETVGGVVNLITTPSFPRIVNEGGSVQFVLSGFRPGTLVNCTLTSSNDAGTGPSATAYISTIQEAPGGPPLNFVIHTITSTNFTVSWEPPNLLLQYGTITGYTLSCTELERNIVPSLFPINYTPDLTNATVSGLRPFTAYSCSLTASNAVGAGPPAIDTPMTEPSAPSGPPQSLTLTLINSTTLTLSWLPIPELQQNGILTNYTVGCNQIPPQLVPVEDTLEMTQSRYMHNITGLRPGVVYSCYVFANTSEGNGPRAVGSITTGEDAPSSPPVNLTVSTLSHTSILIDWAPPSTPNGVIIAYTLYIDHTNGTSTTVNVTRKGSVIDTVYEYTALSPYQLVVVSVSAWTSIGEGPVSPIVHITTDSYIPGPVVDVTYTPSSDGSSLNVSFSSTNQPYSNGMIMNYTVSLVLYTGRDSIQSSTVNTSLDNVVVTFTALSKFVPYNVSIVAFNEIGRGQERTDIVFTAEGAPPKPTITDALRINGSTMFVKWILIPITESHGHISRYTIRYSPNSRKRQQPGSISVPGNRDSVYINGLRAGSTYSVTVSANTGGGEGNSSDSSFVELPPTTTGPGESKEPTCTCTCVHIRVLPINKLEVVGD